jgi:hypothetical protein
MLAGVCRPLTEVGRIRIQNGRCPAVTQEERREMQLSATSPSIPAVLRPVLRCTLTSVLNRLRRRGLRMHANWLAEMSGVHQPKIGGAPARRLPAAIPKTVSPELDRISARVPSGVVRPGTASGSSLKNLSAPPRRRAGPTSRLYRPFDGGRFAYPG